MRRSLSGQLLPYGVAAGISREPPFAAERRSSGGKGRVVVGRQRRGDRATAGAAKQRTGPARAGLGAIVEQEFGSKFVQPAQGERWPGASAQRALASGAGSRRDAHRGIDGEAAAVLPLPQRLCVIVWQQAPARDHATAAGARLPARRRWRSHRARWRHERRPRRRRAETTYAPITETLTRGRPRCRDALMAV